MKALKLFFGLVAMLAVFIAGCVNPPDLPDTPRIVNVNFNKEIALGVFTPETINDSLFLFIEFEDGDADMGEKEGEPDPIITLEDIRTNEITTFSLTGIEVNGALGSIQGTFQVKIKPCCCCGPNGTGIVCFEDDTLPETDEVQYNIHLTDRAGNVSETVLSPVLTLDCYP